MAENKEGQEKTDSASAKKLRDAREKGQVSKSSDVTTAGILLLGGLSVFLFGGALLGTYQGFMKTVFTNIATITINDYSFTHYFSKLLIFMASLILPIILTIFTIAIAGEVAQVGLKWASKKFTSEGMRWEQVFNPFKGMKRIFWSKNSMVELLKSIMKILLLSLVVFFVLRSKDDDIIGLMERPFSDIGTFMADISFELVWKVGVAYLLIAAGDYFWQKWRFAEDMKMTKQETRDEGKQMEGDPQVKARIRQLMRGRLRHIMMDNVPKADVIITNPTHFAVALSYKSGEMNAPKLVAKGADFLAARIRESAKEHGIPIVEQPPLARAVFYGVDVNEEIPEQLFKAVAQVLAYVYSIKHQNQM